METSSNGNVIPVALIVESHLDIGMWTGMTSCGHFPSLCTCTTLLRSLHLQFL